MKSQIECIIRDQLENEREPLGDGSTFLKRMLRIGLNPHHMYYSDLKYLSVTVEIVRQMLAGKRIQLVEPSYKPGAEEKLSVDILVSIAENLPPDEALCLIIQALHPQTFTSKQTVEGSSPVENGLVISNHVLFDFENGKLYYFDGLQGGDTEGNIPAEIVALCKRHTTREVARLDQRKLYWACYVAGINPFWAYKTQEGGHRIWPLGVELRPVMHTVPNGLTFPTHINLFRTKQIKSDWRGHAGGWFMTQAEAEEIRTKMGLDGFPAFIGNDVRKNLIILLGGPVQAWWAAHDAADAHERLAARIQEDARQEELKRGQRERTKAKKAAKRTATV